MKTRLCVAIAAVAILSAPSADAAKIFKKVGTAGAQFLKIGVGGRAVGMGETFVAVADDASCIFWNPAGVARITRDGTSRVSLNHSSWPADISHEFVGYAFTYHGLPGAFAFSSTVLQMDPMAIRTAYSPEGTGRNFDAGDFNLALTWARNLIDRFSFGLTAKYIHMGLADANADGVAVDLGTLYFTDYKTIRIGMAIQNLGPSLRFLEQDFPLPTMFRVGTAMDVYSSANHNLLAAAEFDHPSDNAERASVGAEYTLKAFEPNVTLQIRGGYRYNRDEEGLAGGFGVEFPTGSASWMRVDYAYSDMKFLVGTHKVSAELRF
ncbi:MAG: PorV/PorQ family protein [Gemmatimonadota bacterium]|nr:PorV/PorQ family protein [Gemmatimonadota bacterium]MDP6802308.1 PorV/PorQ family protein [Gemmatimonadota bacterium]MDP7031958.1 PorV/PorQ family protein [Gemmatimonadota bacterium]